LINFKYLNYKKSGKVYNYKINNSPDKKLFISQKHKFKDLVELVEFYKVNSAGLVCTLNAHPNGIVRKSIEKKPSFMNSTNSIDSNNINNHGCQITKNSSSTNNSIHYSEFY
jgi:hypothetical protein